MESLQTGAAFKTVIVNASPREDGSRHRVIGWRMQRDDYRMAQCRFSRWAISKSNEAIGVPKNLEACVITSKKRIDLDLSRSERFVNCKAAFFPPSPFHHSYKKAGCRISQIPNVGYSGWQRDLLHLPGIQKPIFSSQSSAQVLIQPASRIYG